jgi:hypothetical protein
MLFDFDVIVPSIIGAIIGVILTVLYDRYGIVKSYQINLFGINSNSLITGVVIFILVCSFVVLSGISVIVRDIGYIVKEPLQFTIEVLAMGILPTLAFIILMYYRTGKITSRRILESVALLVKFAGLHVLLEISGYYRYVFSE